METQTYSVFELFDQINEIHIPLYQREYAWGEVQCRALWEDFLRLVQGSDEAAHFLGVILADSSGKDGKAWSINDGQQRLTTLLLLIRALQFNGYCSTVKCPQVSTKNMVCARSTTPSVVTSDSTWPPNKPGPTA